MTDIVHQDKELQRQLEQMTDIVDPTASNGLLIQGRRIEELEKALKKISSSSTVAGMHDQDRAPKLQAIARAALE